MTTTKRIQYHRYGGPEVLRLEDADLPQPGAGEIRARVRAAAANAMDWKTRNGEMKIVTGRRFPRGIGHDFAGIVEAVGDGVTRLAVGDEVLGAASLKAPGAFSELVIAEEKSVVRKPPGVSFADAATLPVVGVTAYLALNKVGRLQPGQAVFIAGVLGGVGRSAAQLALASGASVAGSCRATVADEARELGVDPVVDVDFDAAPLRRRFDIVFDTAGALPGSTSRALLKPGGHIIDIVPTPSKVIRSIGSRSFHLMMARPGPEDLEAVARAAADGVLKVPIARTVPLDEAIDALADLERKRGPRGGKLVITTD
jgi:NADPH:quinone reductase-like Zn-dependent oxidoreductase